MLWVPICLCAAVFQAIRNAMQKSLKAKLPDTMVTWSRFLFCFPWVITYFILLLCTGHALPNVSAAFFGYCLIGSLCQIAGSIIIIKLFSRRNFVIGVTYSKTEGVFSLVIAGLLLGEAVSSAANIAVYIGLVGIFLISIVEKHINPIKLVKNSLNKTALLGILCGASYGCNAVLIRQANLELSQTSPDIMINAALTLLTMMSIQVVLLGGLVFREQDNVVKKLKTNIKACSLIGVVSFFAAILFFTGFALTKAPYVVAMGQFEIIVSLFLTHKIFKESIKPLELVGIFLVISCIVTIVLYP